VQKLKESNYTFSKINELKTQIKKIKIMANFFSDKRTILGIVLVLLGGVLLLDNLNILNLYLPRFIYDNPIGVFMMAIGLVLLLNKENKGPGIVLVIIGAFLIAKDEFDFSWRAFWPLVIVIAGASILLRGRFHKADKPNAIGEDDAMDTVDSMNVFGGTQKAIHSDKFKGGRITTIFGGAELNLANCKLAEGTNVIDIFSMFGGATIFIPQDWNVKIDVLPIFGGFSEKKYSYASPVDQSKQLVIKGTVIFGGGEVKRV